MIDVPEVFAQSTVEREGEPGAAWLAGMPALLAESLARWECEADDRERDGPQDLADAPPRPGAVDPVVSQYRVGQTQASGT
ncbi:hypothetical protein [Kribbella sp. NPDC003557]|uniref:hypothetical protein n=1 Tax=Kribbella sp. NPDC003557 TaxID=3154449 RepID=UPI0033A1961A